MKPLTSRRDFLRATAVSGAAIGLGDIGFMAGLPAVSAAETKMDRRMVKYDADTEPLVRLLEDTPRNKLLEEVGARVRSGLTYRELLAAIMLAGVRGIQPRPVGFKFHAVLVIHSAHLASLNSPEGDRWLPLFWAVDQFKSSQARNAQEGNWIMPPVDEVAVPSAEKTREAFRQAVENWDEAATDVAAAGMSRHLGAQEVLELFARYGVRDMRDVAHKSIYVANSWRTLQTIGWQHSEPVLRSLAYALLDKGNGPNPAKNDLKEDRAWRRNVELLKEIKPGWLIGKPDADAMREMLTTLRDGSDEDACRKVVALLNRGVAPASLHDAFFQFSGELLMKKPGIPSLHSVTSSNAMHFAFQHLTNDETRRLVLLQHAAFLVGFKQITLGQDSKSSPLIEKFEAVKPDASGAEGIAEVFAAASRDRMLAARKALGYLENGGSPQAFMDTAQRLIYLKGTDAHDYKFSGSAIEDFHHASPEVRNRCLASSLFYLRGSGSPDNDLVKRTRSALVG